MHRTSPLLPLLAALVWSNAAKAADSCERPSALVAQADQAVVEGRFADMPALVERFDTALSCAEPVDATTLAAFFRAQGAWFSLTGQTVESALAFQSAAQLAPDAWTEAFGATLRTRFDAAAAKEAGAAGSIRLSPPPHDPTLELHIDGLGSGAPATVTPGLHAVQLVRPASADYKPGEARFGRVVAVFPGEDVVVNPGVLSHEEAPAPLVAARPDRPAWALGAGGGALVVAGVTAAMARRQGSVAADATSIAEVNSLEQRQKALAWTSYSFMGLGAVGAGLYFTL